MPLRSFRAVIQSVLLLAASLASLVGSAGNLDDTTAADFGGGTVGVGTYVASTADGEVMLRPAIGDEFGGSTLSAVTWQSNPWSVGGTADVSGGLLHVDGAFVGANGFFTSGRALEFVATFSAQTFQHAGFAVDVNIDPNWAMFSVRGDGSFAARTNNGGAPIDTLLSSVVIGSPHLFRIAWTAGNVTFFIDGDIVATHATSITALMRPIASDLNPGGGELAIDWMRMGQYPVSGTFESRILDAGAISAWIALSRTLQTPAGATVAFETRTGNTASPDGTWSPYAAVPGITIFSPAGRYLQYRAVLTTADRDVSPAIQSVGLTFSTDALLDVDANQRFDALTDGMLVVRYLTGLTDAALTAGALGPGASRVDPVQIKIYLDGIRTRLDVDGDTEFNAPTDGMLILRYLLGLRGNALVNGALGVNAPRTPTEIEAQIQSLMD